MKKITILALHLGYGGVEKYISSLCKMLKDNYDINIISTYKLLDKPAFDFKNIKIEYLINDEPNREKFIEAVKNKKILSIFKESFKAIKLLFLKKYLNIKSIKKIESDYIITTRVFHNALVSKYANKNIIKIATEHNYHNNDKKYVNKVINSLKNYDYFILVSNELKDYYSNLCPNIKCIYIPNVIDYLPKVKSNLLYNNIINVGRLSPEKGQLDLLKVLEIVKREIIDIKLFLIGDGSDKKVLVDYIKFHGLSENVIMTGFLSKEEIEKFMINSKLYVMTSYTESFGLSLIEAMSYHVPCIAFDCASGAREVLAKTGILIKDRNIDEMAKKVINMLKNKNIEKYSNDNYIECQKYLLNNVKMSWIKLLEVSYEKSNKEV